MAGSAGSRNARGERVDEKGPLSDLDCCNGRKVYVLLDANVATNPRCGRRVRRWSGNSSPAIAKRFMCTLPQRNGVNGPDDYIGVCGDEAMAKVFTDARSGAAVAQL